VGRTAPMGAEEFSEQRSFRVVGRSSEQRSGGCVGESGSERRVEGCGVRCREGQGRILAESGTGGDVVAGRCATIEGART
jgi:hypothetical protein